MEEGQNFKFSVNGESFRLHVQSRGFSLWKCGEGKKEKWVIDGSMFSVDGGVTISSNGDVVGFDFVSRPTQNPADASLCEHGKGHCQCSNPRCPNYDG